MRTIRPDRAARPIILLSILVLILAACAGGASSARLSPAGAPVGEAGSGTGNDQGVSGAPGAPAASAAPQRPDGDGVGAVDDARIIRTGTMELQVEDVPTAIRTARDAIRGLGGYVGASTTRNDGEQPYATITYRIPADRWEEALDALRELNGQTKKVVGEETQAVEVTGQVVDLEARIRNLRSSEVALQGIAQTATRISDILEVQNQLTSIRGQIEQLDAQLQDLQDRAGFATLTVTYSASILAVEVAAQGWDPTAIVDEATGSLITVLQALAGAGIWLAIVWLPIIFVLSLVVGIFVWILRRLGVLRRNGAVAPPVPSGE